MEGKVEGKGCKCHTLLALTNLDGCCDILSTSSFFSPEKNTRHLIPAIQLATARLHRKPLAHLLTNRFMSSVKNLVLLIIEKSLIADA